MLLVSLFHIATRIFFVTEDYRKKQSVLLAPIVRKVKAQGIINDAKNMVRIDRLVIYKFICIVCAGHCWAKIS